MWPGKITSAYCYIEDLLKKNVDGSLHSRLSNALLHYRRNGPNSITKVSPSVSPNSRNYGDILEKVNQNYSGSSAQPVRSIPAFAVGDSVLPLNLRLGDRWFDASVLQVLTLTMFLFMILLLFRSVTNINYCHMKEDLQIPI